MTLRYHSRQGDLVPDYVCQRQGIEYGKPICQSIPGANIEKAMDKMLLELVKPVTLEIALAVQHEVQTRLQEADKLMYSEHNTKPISPGIDLCILIHETGWSRINLKRIGMTSSER